MKSTIGRPRRVTDEQIRFILNWHAQYLSWLAQRPAIPTQDALARHLGLSPTVVNRIIYGRRRHKQPTPQDRGAELVRRRLRMSDVE